MLTIKSITHAQISALRSEAAEAHDLAQVVICDRALGGTDTRDDYTAPDQHERAAFDRALEMTEEEATAACVEAINAAQAQA